VPADKESTESCVKHVGGRNVSSGILLVLKGI